MKKRRIKWGGGLIERKSKENGLELHVELRKAKERGEEIAMLSAMPESENQDEGEMPLESTNPRTQRLEVLAEHFEKATERGWSNAKKTDEDPTIAEAEQAKK